VVPNFARNKQLASHQTASEAVVHIDREQLFGALEGLVLIDSEDRYHRDALGQVSSCNE
jgi:hypothetical protein